MRDGSMDYHDQFELLLCRRLLTVSYADVPQKRHPHMNDCVFALSTFCLPAEILLLLFYHDLHMELLSHQTNKLPPPGLPEVLVMVFIDACVAGTKQIKQCDR